MIPEHPPRVRVEWFLATARVGLASGALVAVSFDAPTWAVHNLLISYLIFSLGVLALVWAPVTFGRGWGVALHLFDLAVFSALMVVTNGATSPFFLSLVFLLVCATMRWQVPGTLWTAAAATAAFAAASVYASKFGDGLPLNINTVVIRVVFLMLVAAMLGHLGAHQRRYSDEMGRLAAWPRTMSREPYAVVSEIMSRAGELLNAPRIVLVWHDAEEASVNLAWMAGGRVTWKQEPPDAFGSLVSATLVGRTFHSVNATRDRSRVVMLKQGRFLRRRCRPVDERLRARFEMRSVQSWPLDGDIVRGRLFCLDKATLSFDDLMIGEFVARLATSRLDGIYLLERLQDARALEERVRVARNLHDGLLQSQAGAALQLLAARRVLERDPAAAAQRLEQVQHQLEQGELEMRAFIRDLRPQRRAAADVLRATLRDRLQALAARIEQQWSVKVVPTIDASVDRMDDQVADDVYRLVQEGLVNAARHADPSAIRIDLSVADDCVRLAIADDGKGFPFSGTYDLASLDAMSQGPVTLRERVAELRGNLLLTSSSDSGTELLITVPVATA